MPETIVRHEGEHLYAKQPRSEAGQALSRALLQFRRAEQIQEARAVQTSGLSGLDLRALRYLVQAFRDERDLSPKDLIVMLGTSSANVTNVVERLVAKGYIERISHPTDRRAHYLVPTTAAVDRVHGSFVDHHSTIVAIIDDVSADEASVAAEVITRIARALDQLAREPASSQA